MNVDEIPILRRLFVAYKPHPEERPFLARAQTQTQGDVEVTVAVLDPVESKKFFGVPLARRGIQPVWIKIVNRSKSAYRLNLIGIDPNYFSCYEAAGVNHFSTGKRLLGFGFIGLFYFFPLILLLPFKVFGAWLANRNMDTFFREHAFHLRPAPPGETSEGFVFTSLDAGNKVVHVKLLGPQGSLEMVFNVPVPGFDADYLRHEFTDMYQPAQLVECDVDELRRRLADAPQATTNHKGHRLGDPVNLVVIGDFPMVLGEFGARWDETETITLKSCWKTFKAFLIGSEYRYSPVSGLYLYGRSQDFALQRTRDSINERLHLRLWATPLRFQGQPVWIGQVSRDIGVRFTWRTWNLTTHRIDPDVDEARDYVLEDLLQAERLDLAAYFDGVGPCDRTKPRHNLTGDCYYTDGKRAVIALSHTRATPRFISWS